MSIHKNDVLAFSSSSSLGVREAGKPQQVRLFVACKNNGGDDVNVTRREPCSDARVHQHQPVACDQWLCVREEDRNSCAHLRHQQKLLLA